ncbi:hypothetical protein D9619_007317 [Psilocybe cf. subviscida]|uniref:Uncharacterized protein n=1 Tax=Psilocybe cf. subviscida TaxID=2480587 RepID=A0A8H5B2J9_9AGAR|nr:hypothetical protein D9619_007317 [Psilocybe cf. subviscida]
MSTQSQSLPSFAQAFSDSSLSNALPPIMTRKRAQDSDDDVRVKQENHDPDDDGAPAPSALMPPSPKKRRITVSGAAPHPLHIDVASSTTASSKHHPGSTPISPVVMGFTIQGNNPGAIDTVRNMINVKQKQKALIEQRRGSVAGQPMSPVPPGPHSPVDERPPQLSQNNSSISTSGSTPRARRSPNNGPRRLNNSSQRPPSPQMTPQHVHQTQQSSHHHQAQHQGQQSQSSQQQGQQQQPGPQQVPQQPTPPAPQHSLPPPPISFARRRAALLGGKKKPADIVISPRGSHSREQFQPSIQSAPPIPQGGSYATQQQHPYPDRSVAAISRGNVPSVSSFSTMSMALPRLPSMTGGSERRVVGNVPPTPTRLSMLQQAAQQQQHAPQANPNNGGGSSSLTLQPPPMGPAVSISGGSNNRSPPTTRSPPASIPIATSLVPPTPTSLVHNTSSSANAGVHPGQPQLLGPGTAGTGSGSGPQPRTPGLPTIPQTPIMLARPGGPYSRMAPTAAAAAPSGSGTASEAMMGSSEKAAFLAPFEVFYDALADARQLKNWLGEQLRDSRAALATFDRRVDDKIAAVVDRRVEERLTSALARERDYYERRIAGGEVSFARERDGWEKTLAQERQRMEEMGAEVGSLRARIRDLEDSAAGSSSSGLHSLGGRRPGAKTNGTASPMPVPQPQDGYTFPTQQGLPPTPATAGLGNDESSASATSRLRSNADRPGLSRTMSSPGHRGLSPDPHSEHDARERCGSERAAERERQRELDEGREFERGMQRREWERRDDWRRERDRDRGRPRDYHADYSDHGSRERENERGIRDSDVDRERQPSMDGVHEEQSRMAVDSEPVANGSTTPSSKAKSKGS